MKDYDYVYTVYTEKSFSAAAKKLFVTQPTLSMTVKKIEKELGIKIFDRASTPLKLTDEGQIYIKTVEEIRLAEKNLADKLLDISDLRAGHVTVSGENFVSSFILPEVIMRFSQKYKGIDVAIVESNSPDLRNRLLDESIDLLVAHDFDQELYTARELFSEDVLLAVPSSFEINRRFADFAMTHNEIITDEHLSKAPIDLFEFRNEDFLLMKVGNDMCRRASLICAEAGFTPNARITLDQLITAHNLANAGLGVTFVSDVLVKKTNMSNCVYYKLESKYAKRKMSIGYKKNRYINRAAKAFVETALEVFE